MSASGLEPAARRATLPFWPRRPGLPPRASRRVPRLLGLASLGEEGAASGSHLQRAREPGPAPPPAGEAPGAAGSRPPQRARVSGSARLGWPGVGRGEQTRSFPGWEAPPSWVNRRRNAPPRKLEAQEDCGQPLAPARRSKF